MIPLLINEMLFNQNATGVGVNGGNLILKGIGFTVFLSAIATENHGPFDNGRLLNLWNEEGSEAVEATFPITRVNATAETLSGCSRRSVHHSGALSSAQPQAPSVGLFLI